MKIVITSQQQGKSLTIGFNPNGITLFINMLIPNPHKLIRNSDGIIVGENVYEEDFIEVEEEEEEEID